jgi:hypothetical protein
MKNQKEKVIRGRTLYWKFDCTGNLTKSQPQILASHTQNEKYASQNEKCIYWVFQLFFHCSHLSMKKPQAMISGVTLLFLKLLHIESESDTRHATQTTIKEWRGKLWF